MITTFNNIATNTIHTTANAYIENMHVIQSIQQTLLKHSEEFKKIFKQFKAIDKRFDRLESTIIVLFCVIIAILLIK